MNLTKHEPQIWPPLLTPFNTVGDIDFEALDRLVDFYINQSVAGLLVTGLSAEPFTLSAEERAQVLSRVVSQVDGRVSIAAAIYPESTVIEDWLKCIAEVQDAGANTAVILASTLVPEEASDVSLLDKLRTIVDSSYGDLGLYEAPLPYKRLLSLDAITFAADSGRFTFLKDTSQSTAIIEARLKAITDSPLQLFNAEMSSFRVSMQLGAHGFCGLMANIVPQLLGPVATEGGDAGEELSLLLTIGDTALEKDYPASAKCLLQEAYGVNLSSFSRRLKRGTDYNQCSGLAALHQLLVRYDRLDGSN
ncbi:dihydrodipicolinate synthase family protein [Granulosicoccus antarcticus]|uniref:4-hydroxy-tetrahydrodipicolinate synthase n=1 Tax=Granulosicoccus antarcticus IMCC3135 TaxID=1192854 RepID=A0A2Z2NPN6_9GAMM|nr:dihydrodipicolinate synthase family protein [Granulosicoccus antarcticus]ASJ70740.1 4-hydroxy-tetrahydrodipicolinate synthase [Granulosicoccus antarcticus IMCC3135]